MSRSVYLAGPISHLTYDEAVAWRNDVRAIIDNVSSIVVHDPMRNKEHLIKQFDGKPMSALAPNFDPLTSERGIITRDFHDVRRSDYLFVNFLGAPKVSIGTVCEITLAHELRKPIILVMEDSGNPHEHIFIRQLCDFRVNNIPAGIKILIGLV